MKCPRCQHESPPSAKFCAECGASLVRDCTRCGVRLPGGAKFCPECAQPVAAPAPASEDHALRACYAALGMQAALRRLVDELRHMQGVEARIRVGLNSGEVVVRAIGSDLHMDYTAVGQTTHLAARMEQLAMPGTIWLTAETLRLVEGFADFKSLGPVPVRGLAEPVEAFQLVGAGPVRSRLQ